MTMYELIHQESGIMVYGNEVIVFTCADTAEDNAHPLEFLGTLLWFPQENYFDLDCTYETKDWRELLIGKEIVYDELYDIPQAFFTRAYHAVEATVYELRNGDKIIAPKGWC